ncbi:putative adhesin [Lentzea sp. E54]|uniref:putative adhesin n=1 Tax=Lentzea xerophila TaxID=3435883 RepID=UPI003DA47FF8
MVGGRLFLVGHGRGVVNEPVLVPPGMTVHFYAPEGELLSTMIVHATLATAGREGSLWSAGPSGTPCPNVWLQRWADDEIARALTTLPGEVDAVFVGDGRYPMPAAGLPLCRQPQHCSSAGRHRCGGWLDLLGDSTELHVLACLAADDSEHARLHVTTAADAAAHPDDTLHAELSAEVDLFMALEPAQREQRWSSWPAGTRTMMLSFVDMHEWHAVRSAHRVLAEDGEFALERYARRLPAQERKLLDADRRIAPARERVRAWLGHWHEGLWLADDAAEVLDGLAPRERAALAAGWPSLVQVLEQWAIAFPTGLTAEVLCDMAFEHNAEVLAAMISDVRLPCAVGPDVVVLAPQLLRTGTEHWHQVLARAIEDWPVHDRHCVVAVLPDGLELSGAAVRAHPGSWSAFAAAHPSLGIRTTTARRKPLDVRDLGPLVEPVALRADARAIVDAVDRLNAAADAPERKPPSVPCTPRWTGATPGCGACAISSSPRRCSPSNSGVVASPVCWRPARPSWTSSARKASPSRRSPHCRI